MKLKQLLTTLALVLGLTTTTAFGEEMYYNRLSTGDVNVPQGAYGDIVVPDDGYCATKFPSALDTITEAPGDFGGAYTGIIGKFGSNVDLADHTVAGWFKVPTKSGETTLWVEKTSHTYTSHRGNAIRVSADGHLLVGKIKSNDAWQGSDSHITSTDTVPRDEWFYLTVNFTVDHTARTATAKAYTNGVEIAMPTTAFACNYYGSNCAALKVGNEVECAGLRVDDAVIDDTATIKSWATNETYVKAFVPRKDYAATISTTEPTDITALDWDPAMPAGGFDAGANLTITATVDAVVTAANDLTAKSITFVNEANSITMTKDESATVAVESFDFAEVAGQSALGFDAGAASIVAGVDTTIESLGGNATIGEDMRLTVKGGAFNASWVTNAGTLNFLGGEEGEPISILGDADLGKVTLGTDTYVKFDDKGTTRKYDVTGSGASSVFTVARNGTGSPGMNAGSAFTNLALESIATGTGTYSLWLEHATIDATVRLKLTGAIIMQDLTPANPVVFASLSGSGDLTRYNKATTPANITIRPLEDSEYAGKCSLPLTIDAGSGTQTLSGKYTGALMVNAGATVRLEGSAAPSSISGAGSVTIASNTGTATLTSDLANFGGTITVDASVTTLNLGMSRPTCGFAFEGTTVVQYTENVADDGNVYQLNVTSGAVSSYRVIGTDGTEKSISGGKYEPSVCGGVCLLDYTFTNTVQTTGAREIAPAATSQKTGNLTGDNNTSYTNYNSETGWYEALHTKVRPYRSYQLPTPFTVAVAGCFPSATKTCLVSFGSSVNNMFLASGATNDTVELVRVKASSGNKFTKNDCTVLTTMKVPNAATSLHTVVFETTDLKTINIYLDGVKWSTYVFDEAQTIGSGIQVGGWYGGSASDDCYHQANSTTAPNSYVSAIRLYDSALGPNAIKALAKEFPYVSPNGSFSRTLPNEEQAFWMADGQWVNDKTQETASKPDAGAAVKLTGVTTTAVLINLAEDTTYESITINGDDESALAIRAGGFASFQGKIKAEGLVTVNAPVILDYAAIDIAGVPLTLSENGAITFNLTAFPLDTYFADVYVPLTGISDKHDGHIFVTLPAETPGRKVSFGYDEATQTYGLAINVDETIPFVYTIDESEETGVWTWDKQVVDEATVLAMSKADIVKKGTGTQQFVGASKFGYTVEAGTLMFTNGVSEVTPSITINEGATFDMNGKPDAKYNIVLNGGALVNNGGNLKTNQRQIDTLVLTANSMIGGTGNFDFVRNSHGASALDLGGYTLTKTGDNDFWFDNGIVTNGTVIVNGGRFCIGISGAGGEHKFIDATIEIGAEGVLYISNYDVTISSITGVEGAVLDGNGGKLIGCTLKGNITLAANVKGLCDAEHPLTLDGTTLNLGQNRALVFAGSGTVNAVLTDDEIAQEGPVTIFTTESETVAGGTAYDEAGNVVPGSFTDGSFQVDHEAKIGTKYYLTLQEAIDAAATKATVTLLKDVTTRVTVAADKEFTLDLNGKTLQNAVAGYTLDNAGKLAIVDSAETKGTITHLTADTSSTIRNLGTLEISDITVGGTYIGVKNDEGEGCNGGKGYGELTLNGVTFNGNDQAVQNWGYATINGGTFGGDVFTWADSANQGNVAGVTTIVGGTFNGRVAAVQQYRDGVWPSEKATVTVNGGTFEQKVYGTYTTNYTGEDPQRGIIGVAGTSTAKFRVDETPYATLEVGYKFTKSGDYYVVAPLEVYEVTFSTNKVVVVEATTNVIEQTVLTADMIPAFEDGTWDVEPLGAVITCNTNFNYTISAGPEPIDPSKTDEIVCETEAEAQATAAIINSSIQDTIKAPDAITSEEDKTAYRNLFHARVENTTVYIELTDAAEETLQKEVDDNTVTESVAAALIDPSVGTATINAQTPGLYYWIEGADGVEFESPTLGAAVMATTNGSLELFKPTGLGTNGQAFYKIAVGTKDPNPEN